MDHDLANRHRRQWSPQGCLPSAGQGRRKEECTDKDEPATVCREGMSQSAGPGPHHQNRADQPQSNTESYSHKRGLTGRSIEILVPGPQSSP